MSNLKRFFCILLASVILLSANYSVPAAAGQNAVEAVFGTVTSTQGLKAWHDSDAVPVVVEVAGREGWQLNADKTNYGYIYIDVSDRILHDLKDTALEIEVDYYDEGNGTFLIEYDSYERTDAHTEYVDCMNSLKWKTHTFYIQDALFKNGLSNADFRIAVCSVNLGASRGPVVFGGVRVKQSQYESPLLIDITSEATGNIFFEGDKINFDATYTNKTEKPCELKAVYTAVNSDNEVLWSEERELKVDSKAETAHDVEFSTEEFGLHWLRVEIFDNSGEVYSIKDAEFSYVASNRGARLSLDDGVMTHMESPAKYGDAVLVSDLVKNSGYGYTRSGLTWNSYEQIKGVYTFPPNVKRAFDADIKNGIKQVMILYVSNEWYPGQSKDPAFNKEEPTPYFEERLRHYIKTVVAETKDYVYAYLVGNEEDHPALAPAQRNPENYVKNMKTVYEAVKEIYPEAIVAGLTPTMTDMKWVEGALQAGAKDYMDAIAVHPYAATATLEDSGFIQRMQEVTTLAEKYGCGHMPIWITENGWIVRRNYLISDFEESQQIVRMRIYSDAYDLADKIFDYAFVESQVPQKSGSYGKIRNGTDAYDIDLPYAAQRSLLTIAAWNKEFGGDSEIDRFEDSENVKLYQYDRLSDKKKFIAMWADEGIENVSLSLGVNEVTLMDIMGNKKTVKSSTGDYTFNLNQDTSYVIGDFEDFKVIETKPFEPDALSLSCVEGNSVTLNFTGASAQDGLRIEAESIGDAKVVSKTDFSGGKASVEITLDKSGKSQKDKYLNGLPGRSQYIIEPLTACRDKIVVNVYSGEDLYYTMTVPVERRDTVTVSCTVLPNSREFVDKWCATFTLTNEDKKNAVSGTLEIAQPFEWASEVSAVPFTLEKGETKQILLHLPDTLTDSTVGIVANVNLDNSEHVSYTGKFDMTCAVYTDNAPTIDGVLGDDEWVKRARVFIGNDTYRSLKKLSYNGNEDLSANVYLMWDDEYLYFASEVTDDVHLQTHKDSATWNQDGFQIGFVTDRNTATKFTHVMLARSSNEDYNTCYLFDSEDSSLPKLPIEGSDIKTNRIGNVTVYEAKIPWNGIMPLSNALSIGDGQQASGVVTGEDVVRKTISGNSYLSIGILINDDDGGGRKGFIEYGKGISEASFKEFKNLYFLR